GRDRRPHRHRQPEQLEQQPARGARRAEGRPLAPRRRRERDPRGVVLADVEDRRHRRRVRSRDPRPAGDRAPLRARPDEGRGDAGRARDGRVQAPPRPQARVTGERRTRALALLSGALIAALTIAAYARVAANGFTTFDDHTYVTQNPRVTDGLTLRGVAWA